jgi:hypothetical protein
MSHNSDNLLPAEQASIAAISVQASDASGPSFVVAAQCPPAIDGVVSDNLPAELPPAVSAHDADQVQQCNSVCLPKFICLYFILVLFAVHFKFSNVVYYLIWS